MTSRPRPRFAALFFALLATLSVAATVHAQEAAAEPDTRPAFSLSTSEVFTTRDAPRFLPDLPPRRRSSTSASTR